MSTIRGTSLTGFHDLMRELDADSAPVLAAARIPRHAIGSVDDFIDIRRVIFALELAASATGARDFGRRLALRQGVEILGPVGVAARTAPTVGTALQAVGQYMSVYSPGLAIELAPKDERTAQFVWRLRVARPATHMQGAELGLGASLRIFRILAGDDLRLTEVQLQHDPLMPRSDYESYFGTKKLRFGAPLYGFTLPLPVLDRRLASDAAVHQVVRDFLNSVVTPLDDELTESVRLLVKRMLPTGGLALELVATHLAVHPRTLQRQLAREGRTFAELVDDVRREDGERYLTSTKLPVSQISGLLGYSEQSVFARSCQRWFGKSPTELRRGS